jgi:hypothetical protein
MNKIHGSQKSLIPIFLQHICHSQEREANFNDVTVFLLRNLILLVSMGT